MSLQGELLILRLPGGRQVSLPKPCIMGVINLSLHSFYFPSKNQQFALQTAAKMIKEGAAIIDLGAVATNPFVDIDHALPSVQQEIDQLLPVVEGIKQRWEVLISIDTSRPAVMQAAVAAGADIINDQQSLHNENAMETVAELGAAVCLMHGFSSPRVPGSSSCEDLLQTIQQDLQCTLNRCLAYGMSPQQLLIDPGFGQGHYGKNSAENYYVLANLHRLTELGFPVLVGWSRKSMIGETLGGVPPQERLYGSVAAATIAVLQGAAILRVHDVAPTLDALRIANQFLIYHNAPKDLFL